MRLFRVHVRSKDRQYGTNLVLGFESQELGRQILSSWNAKEHVSWHYALPSQMGIEVPDALARNEEKVHRFYDESGLCFLSPRNPRLPDTQAQWQRLYDHYGYSDVFQPSRLADRIAEVPKPPKREPRRPDLFERTLMCLGVEMHR